MFFTVISVYWACSEYLSAPRAQLGACARTSDNGGARFALSASACQHLLLCRPVHACGFLSFISLEALTSPILLEQLMAPARLWVGGGVGVQLVRLWAAGIKVSSILAVNGALLAAGGTTGVCSWPPGEAPLRNSRGHNAARGNVAGTDQEAAPVSHTFSQGGGRLGLFTSWLMLGHAGTQ